MVSKCALCAKEMEFTESQIAILVLGEFFPRFSGSFNGGVVRGSFGGI